MESAERKETFSPAMRKLGEYLDKTETKKLVQLSVTDLSEAAGVSEATVLRLCRRLGFKGYSDFRVTLAREGKGCLEEKPQDLASKIQTEYLAIFESCRRSVSPAAVKEAVGLIAGAEKVCCYSSAEAELAALELKSRLLELGIFAAKEEDPLLRSMVIPSCGERDLLVVLGEDTGRAAQLARAHGVKILSVGWENPFADCSLAAECEGRGERLAPLFLVDILCAGLYRAQPARFEVALARSACSIAGNKL